MMDDYDAHGDEGSLTDGNLMYACKHVRSQEVTGQLWRKRFVTVCREEGRVDLKSPGRGRDRLSHFTARDVGFRKCLQISERIFKVG